MEANASSQIRPCSVLKAELLFGAEKSSKRELVHQKLEVFFSRFKSMPFDDAAANSYGIIRAALETAGQSIGPNDTLIAAIALANGLIVVTHNTREFRRVPGLPECASSPSLMGCLRSGGAQGAQCDEPSRGSFKRCSVVKRYSCRRFLYD